ncbi:metallophosphoesterase family protein [Ferrimonas balearica]|uniref:metallophosphoesterase family protein n=1 Tax=Ferrimonas balearica TaxID=44012 RepID=UPI001C9A2675|nr:metallophosphoesterase [Ferrimonas balearica]MBY5992574.1 metallophosphoesterase [Ferrimonas balearica]
MFKKTTLALLTAAALAGCNSSSDSNDTPAPAPGPLKIGVLTDTQGGGDAVALPQMEAILDLYREQGIQYVIAVGDLTNSNTEHEYEAWREMAHRYSDAITFLPLMGNHDRKPGDNYTWKRVMQEFIPEDAVHMPGRHFQTYAYTSGNALMIQISDQDKPYAYSWVEEMIEGRDSAIEHVFVSTHSPFVGPYRGGIVYENVVARWGNQLENDLVTADLVKWRNLLSQNDVIYLSGHDHQYSRSVIWDNGAGNGTFTDEEASESGDRDLRFFTQIVTGNASDKSYYNRIGEFEKIQDMVMYRTTTPNGRDGGSSSDRWTEQENARDLQGPGVTQINASWFEITGPVLSFQAYYDDWVNPEDVLDGGADWRLFDRFTRTPQRCDKVVHPDSLPEASRYYSVADAQYRTVRCLSDNGDVARLMDGTNRLFNRVDQALYGADWISSSIANLEYIDRLNTLMKVRSSLGNNTIGSDRNYQVDGRYAINYGHPKGYEVTALGAFRWHPHTYDMKKLVSLSWAPATAETLSDVLIVSGIQGQSGLYANPFGRMLDIALDEGRPGTGIVDNPSDRRNLDVQNKPALNYVELLDAKSPYRLDERDNWTLNADLRHGALRADDYVLEFRLPAGVNADEVTLAHFDGEQWVPLVSNQECISTAAYDARYLTQAPNDLTGEACDPNLTVGLHDGHFWAKLDFEGQFAIVRR